MAFQERYSQSSIRLSPINHKLPKSDFKYIANSQQTQFLLTREVWKVFIGNIPWKLRFPVDTMKQSRYIRQIFCIKSASILTWIRIKVLFVIFRIRIQRLDAILSVNWYHINRVSMFRTVSVNPNPLQFAWFYLCDRKILENLNAALSASAPSCNGKDEGSHFLWNFFFLDFLSY